MVHSWICPAEASDDVLGVFIPDVKKKRQEINSRLSDDSS